MRKFLPYIFILIILVGLFGPTKQVHAVPCDVLGQPIGCTGGPAPAVGPTQPPAPSDASAFQKYLATKECSADSFTVSGCLLQLFYYIFNTIASILLMLCGMFFNAVVAITLSSRMYSGSSFIPSAWVIVRDLSNIFFILVLLYVAIRLILGFGGSETKKMIVTVIITALLINFSMFFTEVVVDASNVLALIFYNKINVETSLNGTPRPYIPITNIGGEKDISGGLVSAFDPSKALTADFFKKAAQTVVPGNPITIGNAVGAVLIGPLYVQSKIVGWLAGPTTEVPPSLVFAIILVAGLIMLFAAYAFFIAGISFLGRLIELWILIIFSPFAFMSLTIPILEKKVDYIGWEAWLKRLLSVAFMAPIFMFFMYFIFLVVRANVFGSLSRGLGAKSLWTEDLLMIVMGAMIILVLLMKATSFAKKGGGKFAEVTIGAAKVVGGLALGAGIGGAALAARGVIGGAGGAGLNKLAEKVGPGRTANMLKNTSAFLQNKTFDPRNVKIAGKSLASVTGLSLGEGSKSSWTGMKKEQVENRQKRVAELEKRGTGKERVAKEEAEATLREATVPVKLDLAKANKKIDQARIDLNDAKNSGIDSDIKEAKRALDEAKREKAIIRGAKYTDASGMVVPQVVGGLADLENKVHEAEQKLDEASERITKGYAEKISSTGNKNINQIIRIGTLGVFGTGMYSRAADDEAARKIRNGTKLDSGEKPH